SESFGQPVASTVAPAGVSGHLSIPFSTPSLSESEGQPWLSTVAPSGVSGQASVWSVTPSRSASPATARLPPSDWKKDNPAEATRWVALVANVLCVWGEKMPRASNRKARRELMYILMPAPLWKPPSVNLYGLVPPKSSREYPPSTYTVIRLALSVLITRLPEPINGSISLVDVMFWGDWKSASTSSPISGVTAYEKRTPPPSLSESPNVLSYLV